MLTPAEIMGGEFDRRFRGYDTQRVDDLLGALFAEYEEAWVARSDLQERAQGLESGLAECAELDRRLCETFVSAQADVERLRREASAEAEAVLDTVRAEVREEHAATEREMARVTGEIERMRDLDAELRARLRGLIETALERLAEKSGEGPSDDTAQLETPAPEPVAGSPPVEPPDLGSTAFAPDDTQTIPALAAELEPEALWEPSAAHRPDRRPLVYSLAILLVGALVAIGIWQLSGRDGSLKGAPATQVRSGGAGEAVASPASAALVEAAVREPVSGVDRAGAAPPEVRLVLRAATGESWLLVRLGSAKGRILYEGFLENGSSREFAGARLWVRFGAAHRLSATLNGRPVKNLPVGTADVLVTAKRLRTVSLG